MAEGQRVTSLNADRPQSLLAYLLLHRSSPQSRSQVAYTLWPDSTDEQARTNLRNLLHTLRHALPDAESFLALDVHTVQWRPDADVWLDVAEFQTAMTAAQQTHDSQLKKRWLETAVALYKGPLLPGSYADWIIPRREELQQAYLTALNELAVLLEQQGEYQTAIQYTRRYQQQDPLDETAVIRLMRLLAHNGDRAGVHRAYETCAATLQRELGILPGRETQTAYAQMLHLADETGEERQMAGETAVPVIPATTRTAPHQSWRLTPQSTPFIGRNDELARLAQLLADPQCRLVTVVGPGGVGKTRLALQAATGHVTIFAQGAAFVALTAVSDSSHIPSTIAQSLNFSLKTSLPRQAQLLQYLQDKELLLVLDNLEQLRREAVFLSEILCAAPRVKLLVTSRQRLNLPEEWVFDLRGLPLPDEERLDCLEENSAAALFLQTARRHDTTFKLLATDRAAIVRICRLVDGMPLGLELAAAWVRLLSCAEIAAEIESNLDFLTVSEPDVSDRHRSMRAVFDQSWGLLTGVEQTAFSCLSLFRGGFAREAAQQVAEASLPVLSGLLDKSLVRRLGNGRYDIHELVRQYAAHQLSADPVRLAEARTRFTAYFLSLAEMAADQLTGPDQQTWLERLEHEYDNLRLVLQWEIAAGNRETAVRLGAALGRFWWLRYRPQEGSDWLRQILTLSPENTVERARVLAYAGLLARVRQSYAEAGQYLTESIRIQRALGEKRDLGQSINELGMLAIDQGDFTRAQTLFAEWLELARELNYPHGITIALLNLGMTAHHRSDYAAAAEFYTESLALSRQSRLKINVAMALNSYGQLLLDQNMIEKARVTLRESVQINESLGYKEGLSWAFVGLVTVAVMQGELELAVRLLGVTEALRQAVGVPLPPANQARFDEVIIQLQERLGAEMFADQLQIGRQIPLEEAAALVLRWISA